MVFKPACAACGRVLEQALQCSRCKASYYCNRECQRLQWKEHKRVCRPPTAETPGGGGSGSSSEKTKGVAPPRAFKDRVTRTSFRDFPNAEWLPAPQRHRPDRPAPNLLILLHGLGDDEQKFAALGRNMALPGMEVLSVRGPYVVPPGDMGFGWYPAYEADGELIKGKPGEQRRIAGLDAAVQRLHGLLDELTGMGWHMRGVFLLGFGQGALTALDAGLSYRQLLGGVMALSGGCFLEEYDDTGLEALAQARGWQQAELPLHVTHLTAPVYLPMERAITQATLLKPWCKKLIFHSYTDSQLLASEAQVRELFEYLSPLMVTSLHEMSLNGEVHEVASVQ
ncbi:uncharacterized protein MONBRDRAFT_7779 [Monosiga brevicollis MX1]|uniref:MYND-type domain-containing protein n=1 Tax=Monosiga brevicollis TaxID=81824 RepID=A9UYA7_MONBE|nr:uncharacterized protein MONBRDRAFT_7779 [Monosiga brevicollis MX1]EDQ89827.1 predicted protein [Monosiga brevicollis MX1]|eukprot:XP_001745249.1 hypothetical protein [Monosiga brevicollis MX1]